MDAFLGSSEIPQLTLLTPWTHLLQVWFDPSIYNQHDYSRVKTDPSLNQISRYYCLETEVEGQSPPTPSEFFYITALVSQELVIRWRRQRQTEGKLQASDSRPPQDSTLQCQRSSHSSHLQHSPELLVLLQTWSPACGAIERQWNLGQVGLGIIKLGHWQHAFERDTGTPPSYPFVSWPQ